MAEQEEHHHPHRTMASANITSANDGSVSQVNVNVLDSDEIFNPSGGPLTTTTISTIAVQAGEARIVLAVLRVRTLVFVHSITFVYSNRIFKKSVRAQTSFEFEFNKWNPT